MVLLPDDASGTPDVIDVDEDMLLVFAVDGCWLVVCEASVRLISDGQETSRLELADVVREARWRGPELAVLQASHQLVEIAIRERRPVSKLAD